MSAKLVIGASSDILYLMQDTSQLTTVAQWLGAGSINLFGRPFAGKDSQGRFLIERLGGNLLGGGDILRGTTMPDDIKLAMRSGNLIPSEDYVNIVLPYLSQETLRDKPLILSSVGRWHGEEQGVINALESSHHPLKSVIYLRLEEEEVIRRWRVHKNHDDRKGRHDDSEEVLAIRFREFRDKTLPVINFYSHLGLLIEVDGTKSREEVAKIILEKLYQQAIAA